MKIRRSHYEMAFEAYLDQRGTPYVMIEDVRHLVKGRLGAKAFDYIVYPPGRAPCLVDVKGRKINAAPSKPDARSKNWVTRGDLEGLRAWQDAFGPEYEAMFVFGFWLSGGKGPDAIQPGLFGPVASLAGRVYSFWLVKLSDYAQRSKLLSRRWDTVTIPTEEFRRISQQIEAAWPAAPC
jgi:hypothetical protein